MGEICEVRVGKERHVTEQLVAAIGLGCVERGGVVANVLSGVEHAERQTVEEIAGGQEAGERRRGYIVREKYEMVGCLLINCNNTETWKSAK